MNSKSYDICKEVKAIVESSSAPSPTEVDFPNALIAKLLKVRLLIFKEDGLEKKAAALKAAAVWLEGRDG